MQVLSKTKEQKSSAQQLNLNFSLSEASTFHNQSSGYFSVNYSNASTIKAAETNRSKLLDMLDYQAGRYDDRMAQKHGAASADERIIQLKSELKGKSTKPLIQRMYPVAKLPWVISQLMKMPDFPQSDCYISQNGFASPQNRQATNVQHINMLFADLDIAKQDPAWLNSMTDEQRKFSGYLRSLSPERQSEEVIAWCDTEGLPRPSFILFSGGGLHLKWIFSQSVQRSAKPLWDKLEEHLIGHLARGGFPVDIAVRDVSRILRLAGSTNQKRNALCREVWINSDTGLIADCRRYDFNDLADGKRIMPWSREEARSFKTDMKIKTSLWDKNRALANTYAAQAFIEGLKRPSKAVSEYLSKDLWQARLEMIRRTFPNGVPEGQRNSILWISANALAHCASAADNYKRDLVPVLREICPTFSDSEIRSAASSVTRRIEEEHGHGKGLYRMTNSKFNELLGITEEAWAGHGRSARPNEGKMGFEKMANLPFDEYLQETRRRQSVGGKARAIEKAKANEEKRAMARQMAANGIKQRAIATELGVSLGSVNKWISS